MTGSAAGARVALRIMEGRFGTDGPLDRERWLEVLATLDDVVARRAALRLVDVFGVDDGWPSLADLEKVAAAVEQWGRAGQLAQAPQRSKGTR